MLRCSYVLRCAAASAATVLFQDFAGARLVTLNKPKAMNALDPEMVDELHRLYITEPKENALYVIKGAGGKAFCAGGNVINITRDDPPGISREFFFKEYQFNYHLMVMAAPNVALWDGYAIGGGVGLSLPGRYRVATERAKFALSEAAIGMIPDVGSAWLLPRLPIPGLGLYLGLTGARVSGADVFHTGLATHYVPSALLPELEAALCDLRDPRRVQGVLDDFHSRSPVPPCTLESHYPLLAKVFGLSEATTLPAVLEGVRAHAAESEVIRGAQVLFGMSPSSLGVAVELVKRGARCASPIEAFRLEYLASQRVCAEHDFAEGVRATLIDKDKKFNWRPATVEELTPAYIQSYFEPTYAGQRVWEPAPQSPRV